MLNLLLRTDLRRQKHDRSLKLLQLMDPCTFMCLYMYEYIVLSRAQFHSKLFIKANDLRTRELHAYLFDASKVVISLNFLIIWLIA